MAYKKDGTLRFYIDYRELNKVTWKDAYIHVQNGLLDQIGQPRYFTKLDLAYG